MCLDPDVTTTTKCLTNANCGGVNSGYYCNYTTYDENTYCTEDGPTAMGCAGETNPANCEKAGTCTKIGTITKANIPELGVVFAAPAYSWWGAKNWCQALGKDLIPVEKFKAYHQGTTLVTANMAPTTGAVTYDACRQGKTCTRWDAGYDANRMWKTNSGVNTRTLTDAKDENGELYQAKYSPVILHLAQQFRGTKAYLWTDSNAKSSNECYAAIIAVNYGAVPYYYNRFRNYFNVLCY